MSRSERGGLRGRSPRESHWRLQTLLLLAVVGVGSGCASGPSGAPAPAQSTFDAIAADLIPQIVEQDIALAIARPLDAKTETLMSWMSHAVGTRERRLETYPDKLLAAFVRAKSARTPSGTGPKPKLRLLTRAHLLLLLEEQGLQWSDLMPTNPKTRVRLKAITAVQAYVVWRIELMETHNRGHPDNRTYENWTLMVISVQTGELMAASKVHRHYLD